MSDAWLAVLPLILLVLAGLVPSRHEPDSAFLAKQQWRYRDVIIVCAILTARQWAPLPFLSTASGMRLFALSYGVTAFVIIASVWGVVRWQHPRPWRTLGFDPTTAPYSLLWSLRIGLGLVSVAAVFMVMLVLSSPDIDNRAAATRRLAWQGQVGDYIAAVLVNTLFMPLAEELFFRGLSYAPLSRKFGMAGATVGTAVFWAVLHYSDSTYISLTRMSVLFVIGIVYAEVYRRRQSLVPTVVFHSLSNTISMFKDERYLGPLLTLAGVSVALWIMSAALFCVVNRSRKSVRVAESI